MLGCSAASIMLRINVMRVTPAVPEPSVRMENGTMKEVVKVSLSSVLKSGGHSKCE